MKDDLIKILSESKTVAIVGISDKPERPSHKVAKYLKKHGYTIIPVNPRIKEVLGEKCYASLIEVKVSVDIVDIFRKPEEVLPIVESAIKIGAKTIWMQEGIINDKAADTATTEGLSVIMDHCMLKEHSRLSGWIYD